MPQTKAILDKLKPRIISVPQWIWVFTVIIGVAVLFKGGLNAQRMLVCGGWPVVQGVIEKSDLKRGLMREGALKFQIHIVYRYTVDGVVYQGRRLSFAQKAKGQANLRSILAAYPIGKIVTVHHSPSNPALSVLETPVSWHGLKLLVLGLLLTVLGFIGIWRRWSLQTDYLFKERDSNQPVSKVKIAVGSLGMVACLGIFWLWWELIKMYAGR